MKKIEKIEDLSPDDLNANKGTERGYEAIERSLQKYGAGRSILVDKNGRTIAGNKTLEKAAAAGLEIVPVHTKGDKLVVVIRDDLDIESKQARELAIADNRSAELGLDWDMKNIKALMDDGIDVSDFWTDGELDRLIQNDDQKKDNDLEIDKIYEVIVECLDEREQQKVYEQLTTKIGLKCRILTL